MVFGAFVLNVVGKAPRLKLVMMGQITYIAAPSVVVLI
jgi:hypothetical protein